MAICDAIYGMPDILDIEPFIEAVPLVLSDYHIWAYYIALSYRHIWVYSTAILPSIEAVPLVLSSIPCSPVQYPMESCPVPHILLYPV